jgi:hypothetical protein
LDLKRLPPKVVQQARLLLEGEFVDRHENMLAFGSVASGKTHLLAAIAQELVRSGRKVLFTTCNLLVQELLIAKRDLKLSRLLKRVAGFAVLLIDDLGYGATKPGGDGSAVHAVGGAVRAGQRDADEQPAVLAVGADLQEPDDDGGSFVITRAAAVEAPVRPRCQRPRVGAPALTLVRRLHVVVSVEEHHRSAGTSPEPFAVDERVRLG